MYRGQQVNLLPLNIYTNLLIVPITVIEVRITGKGETSMSDYALFVEHVYQKTGIDLADYKEAQMRRRLTSFRDREGYMSFKKMVHALDEDPVLLKRLLNRITINVSEFFRNPERWRCLQEDILPDLAKKHARLKCWSAACSTGEEPYTLAIMLKQLRHPFDLWATDIDRSALERAKAGVYDGQALKHMKDAFKKRYVLSRDHNRFCVSDELKKEIRFARHDLLRDVYPERCHLIVCRNVLIYFTDEAKNRIYRDFSQSLVPGGVLFVGSTEQILRPSEYGFTSIAPFVYQRTTEVNKVKE